jgi:hypothetical protein
MNNRSLHQILYYSEEAYVFQDSGKEQAEKKQFRKRVHSANP